MAGEWISVDCCLAQKPETLQIMAATGQPPDVVVGRLAIFWAWCQLNAVDGVVSGNPGVLAIVAGGDAGFWLAVADAGWLTFEDAGKVRISGWEDRFSQAAKERLKDRRRKTDGRKSDRVRTRSGHKPDTNRTTSGQLPDTNQTRDGLEEKRREEIEESRCCSGQTPPPTSADFVDEDPLAGWEAFSQAWKAAGLQGLPSGLTPPDGFARAVLERPGWLAMALRQIPRLPKLPFFDRPPSFWQAIKPDFFAKCESGAFDAAKFRPGEQGKPPPPKRWMDEYKPAEYRRPKELAEITGALKVRGVDD